MSSDLFHKDPEPPLAEALRPKSIDEVIGQAHLLGEGKPLRVVFRSGKAHSMILWGPPGVGKTTLARLAATAFNSEFIALSAVLSGVKEIRAAIDSAQLNLDQYRRATILFIDEIHRFNKGQQDALLPFVESGLITFIGATTENPSFEVNSALLSRAQVYVLKSLDEAELRILFDRAKEKILPGVKFEETAISVIIGFADGDARRLLNLLEQLAIAFQEHLRSQPLSPTSQPPSIGMGEGEALTAEFVKNALAASLRRFDKGGENFYDQISALHKSVRGSHPDAALYWFMRMIDGGADPRYLARRIIRMAWEDIGLADPRAAQLALCASDTYERLGSPEGELALAQTVIYMAVAAKSNAGYMAYNEAAAFVKNDKSREVPIHLRNAPTKLMKELGYGHTYRYAHDEPGAYAAGETYMPEGMRELGWYKPVDRGLEIQIKEKLEELKRKDREAGKK